jgi:hypothetical protein
LYWLINSFRFEFGTSVDGGCVSTEGVESGAFVDNGCISAEGVESGASVNEGDVLIEGIVYFKTEMKL